MKRIGVFAMVLSLAVLGLNAWAQGTGVDEMRARMDELGRAPKIAGSPEMIELGNLNRAYNDAMPATGGNDSCTAPTPIGCGDVVAFDTTGATSGDTTWDCALGGSEIWYSITGNGGNITFETCGSSYDTALQLHSGTCGALVNEACNDDSCGLQSSITWLSGAGTDYLVAVGGFNGGTGAGTLTVTCDIPAELTGFEVE